MCSRMDKKQQQYIKMWDNMGIRINKTLKFFLFLTIVTQLIIVLDLRLLPINTTIKLEGDAFVESYYYESKGTIKLIAENLYDIFQINIYINGEVYENTNNEYIILNVRNNDVIEIDSRKVNKKISIIVDDTTENVVFPTKGMRYDIERDMLNIGRVKLR